MGHVLSPLKSYETSLICLAMQVSTEGDAFTMAFHDPIDACGWALEIQHKLLTLPWPPELLTQTDACEQRSPAGVEGDELMFKGLRVRVAIHTGQPDSIQVIAKTAVKSLPWHVHICHVLLGKRQLISGEHVLKVSLMHAQCKIVHTHLYIAITCSNKGDPCDMGSEVFTVSGQALVGLLSGRQMLISGATCQCNCYL